MATQITQVIGSKLKHIISMSELNKFTRLFKNVKNCKNLNWQEKAILSEIISYQLEQRPFKLKDLTIADKLALDKGSVSKFIRQLAHKDVINKETITYVSDSGGKPKRLRTITVIEIEKWTDGYVIPVTMTNEHSNEKVEKKNDNAEKESENVIDMIILDSEQDVDNSYAIGKSIIAKIKNKEDVEFKMVSVKFGEEIMNDEATLIQNGSNKYFLKSLINLMDASVFE